MKNQGLIRIFWRGVAVELRQAKHACRPKLCQEDDSPIITVLLKFSIFMTPEGEGGLATPSTPHGSAPENIATVICTAILANST